MVSAASLIGRQVRDVSGLVLGLVVDVGIGEQGAPKFLLVGADAASARGARRYEMGDVGDLQGDVVVIVPRSSLLTRAALRGG